MNRAPFLGARAPDLLPTRRRRALPGSHVRELPVPARRGVDESPVTLADAVRIAREGVAEVFGIKLNRVGGLTRARRMRDVALAHGIQMFVMATGGSVLADTEAAHLAQSIPEELVRACWSCQDVPSVDVAPGRGPRCTDGYITVGDAPGLGVEPDAALLGDPVAVYGPAQ